MIELLFVFDLREKKILEYERDMLNTYVALVLLLSMTDVFI